MITPDSTHLQSHLIQEQNCKIGSARCKTIKYTIFKTLISQNTCRGLYVSIVKTHKLHEFYTKKPKTPAAVRNKDKVFQLQQFRLCKIIVFHSYWTYSKRPKTIRKTRIQSQRNRKFTCSHKIAFIKLNRTLASKTSTIGQNIKINNWKSERIAFISRNMIVEFSNPKQLKLIGVTLSQLKNKFKMVVVQKEKDIKVLNKEAKKVNNHATGITCLKKMKEYTYKDNEERSIKAIYVHILDQIVNKPLLFRDESQRSFSEASFLAKFWGPIVELFFDPNRYFIQWGDTTSVHLSLANIAYNLDFRVIINDINSEALDVATS